MTETVERLVPLTPESERNLSALRRALRRARGVFALYVCIARDAARSEALRRFRIWSGNDGIPELVFFDTASGGERLDHLLSERIEARSLPGAVFGSQEELLQAVGIGTAALNMARDRLGTVVTGPLVVLVSPDGAKDLARAAPDLWDVRAGTFELEPASGELAPEMDTKSPGEEEPRGSTEELQRRAVFLWRAADRAETGDGPPAQALSDQWRALAFEFLKAGDSGEAEVAAREAERWARLGGYTAGIAGALRERARALESRGEHELREELLRDAVDLYKRVGEERELARTWSLLADLRHGAGDPAGALHIQRERVLPTYERLGDARGCAITLGRIADVVESYGDLDTALRIRREEELPVYERIGDRHARALTLAKVGDVHLARGELVHALTIWQTEVLPVLERLGDPRESAVTLGRIADVLEMQGRQNEALRIRREQELPVYERIGDVRARSVVLGKIAGILRSQGEFGEALRILREEVLPGLEHVGDSRGCAITVGRIADVLEDEGDVAEALRIRREDELPVYERIGDVRGRAGTLGKIANALMERGELDSALAILRDEALPALESVGDFRGRANTLGRIADALEKKGKLDEALRIRREEELPAYERLGDVREHAVALGKIAHVLAARRELDEALRIYQEQVLPAFERLGAPPDLIVARARTALVLLTRDAAGDREAARRLLCEVREKARTLGLPVLADIEATLGAHGLDCL